MQCCATVRATYRKQQILHLWNLKTNFISSNQQGSIQTVSGESIESVESFTYLGSKINSTEKDKKIRIAKARTALNRMDTVWKSALSDILKRSLYLASVESVLMYGVSAWSGIN